MTKTAKDLKWFVRVDKDAHRALKFAAAARGTMMNALVNELITQTFANELAQAKQLTGQQE